MKTKSIIISLSILVLIGAMTWRLAGNKKEINCRKEVKTIESNIAVSIEPALMQEAGSYLDLVGISEPDKTVIVASESTGKINKINIQLGGFVGKGSVLAEVDNTFKRLAFDNAQLNYTKFKEDYQRYQVLRKGDAVSENQLRDMKMSFDNAANQLENARKQLEDTKITAPFSGVIISKKTELGAYVNPGTPIAEIADIAQLKVMLSVSESTVYQLHIGQGVNITANVYPGQNYKGSVSSISPQGSNSHTFPVEILLANDNKLPLKAGTYVNVRVEMGKNRKALMIPRNAIISSIKDPSVYVVNGETVKLVKIATGQEYKSYLEVTSGINEGDQVVTSGQINLLDGSKVSVIKN
jgi:membrane fusion protein, multidrug efflux system